MLFILFSNIASETLAETQEPSAMDAPPVIANIKREVEFPEAAVHGLNEQGAAGSMPLVCFYVRAAFEAMFHDPNFQTQVAAVSALPTNWGHPTDVSEEQVLH